MSWDITEDFEYVVTKKEQPRLCFASSLDRETLPMSGPCLSPFMRRMTPEVVANRGPGIYELKRGAFYDYQTRITSKKGIGPLAPRFKSSHVFQPPPQEPPPPPPVKQHCAPFNSTSRRKPLFVSTRVPAERQKKIKGKSYHAPSSRLQPVRRRDGETNSPTNMLRVVCRPCDYLPQFKRRSMKFAYSFGGKKVLRCPVMIKCVPYNLDACGVCDCSCSAQGDYWQFENRIFLCRRHYNRLFTHCLAKFQGAKLADFKSVRDCFFAHAHNSCKAALKIMSVEAIEKKLRKEAYLDLYFPQRRFCEQ